ncbi:hypothetical protein [uncultured Deinococcus sp.]|uniref:hypothetical protein n=1 Tax=uncultured Deinococcus sp. TaxID=158789 RepID=UPI0037488843
MFRTLCSALLGAALLGTPAAASAPVPTPWTLTLAAGQTASVPATPGQPAAKVTLLSFSDSRCPPRAYCFVAGNVKARVFVTRGASSRLYTLTLPGVSAATLAGPLRLTAATRPGQGPQRLTLRGQR